MNTRRRKSSRRLRLPSLPAFVLPGCHRYGVRTKPGLVVAVPLSANYGDLVSSREVGPRVSFGYNIFHDRTGD